jgi:Tol biopolymer transport system component
VREHAFFCGNEGLSVFRTHRRSPVRKPIPLDRCGFIVVPAVRNVNSAVRLFVALIVVSVTSAGIDDARASEDAKGRIAFASGRVNVQGNSYFDIYVMNADGSGRRRLTRVSADYDSPAWSPDGRRIAFEHGGDIYVLNPDGGGQRRLTRNPSYNDSPTWSPDGRRIAFSSTRSGNGDVYVMNADGSGQRRLTRNPREDNDPAWSPVP